MSPVVKFGLLCIFFAGIVEGLVLHGAETQGTSTQQREVNNTTVNSGDIIQIRIDEDPNFVFRGPVNSSGYIDLPYNIGEFKASGLTYSELENALQKKLTESHYRKATVQAIQIQEAAGQVYVYGAVKEPGIILLPPSGYFTIPQILASVKGLTAWSDPKSAYILRYGENGSKERIPIDISVQIMALEDQAPLEVLENGDELYIPGINQGQGSSLLTNDPIEVIVVGQINSPGIVTFAPGEEATFMRTIFKAGGLTKFARSTQVKLIRYAGSDRSVEIINAEEIIEEGYLDKDVPMNSGDMIIVPQKFINF
ncbi:polysaccharide biosynthesis/export family protein [Rubellicoccus peritrichatus]|uniref:SLBB domain-containing protein n=1 Tax=Rubellicoccus peritrichatus TaxID=3080537 RepID=A0AAQ3LFZ8_9BACT|nr:SLBB domain-containing protein [Puniceicoccus sp. CR14]WOO41419.1 SLBB domain-containing protein [Puniceicoccus sp. CR14]